MFDYIVDEDTLRLLESMETAVVPWHSVEALSKETLSHLQTTRLFINKEWKTDPQEQINKCLSCNELTCNDCITLKRRNKIYATKKLTIKETKLIEVQM